MAENECKHGYGCVECEKHRLADITADAVQSIRSVIGRHNTEMVDTENWNENDLGDPIAGAVFEAVTKAAKFPDIRVEPLY